MKTYTDDNAARVSRRVCTNQVTGWQPATPLPTLGNLRLQATCPAGATPLNPHRSGWRSGANTLLAPCFTPLLCHHPLICWTASEAAAPIFAQPGHTTTAKAQVHATSVHDNPLSKCRAPHAVHAFALLQSFPAAASPTEKMHHNCNCWFAATTANIQQAEKHRAAAQPEQLCCTASP